LTHLETFRNIEILIRAHGSVGVALISIHEEPIYWRAPRGKCFFCGVGGAPVCECRLGNLGTLRKSSAS
jgi:hypothetical protein